MSLPTPAAEPGDACRNTTGCSASPSITQAQPWRAQAALASPSLIPAWHFVLQQVQLSPVSHFTLSWHPPRVLRQQHHGFVVQEPLGLEVRRDERYLGGKKGRAQGLCWASQGPLALTVGKGPECPFSWV